MPTDTTTPTTAPHQTCLQCKERKPRTRVHFKVIRAPDQSVRFAPVCRECQRTAPQQQRDDAADRFNRIMDQLESVHGPYSTWTSAVHEEHTRRLCDAIGWQDQQTRMAHAIPFDYSDPRFNAPTLHRSHA